MKTRKKPAAIDFSKLPLTPQERANVAAAQAAAAQLKKGRGRVRGATRVDCRGHAIADYPAWREAHPDALCFDSRLEWRCWSHLKASGVAFDLKPETFELQPGFRDGAGEWVRPICVTLDFYVPFCDLWIDTKGHATETFALRLKLLRHHFHQRGKTLTLVLPDTARAVDALVLELQRDWAERKKR